MHDTASLLPLRSYLSPLYTDPLGLALGAKLLIYELRSRRLLKIVVKETLEFFDERFSEDEFFVIYIALRWYRALCSEVAAATRADKKLTLVEAYDSYPVVRSDFAVVIPRKTSASDKGRKRKNLASAKRAKKKLIVLPPLKA
ncbi:uncharacterized protein MYCFIDRAFT_200325 [Pseudocercospora fijiensis CIRAD86]|uniref:Uncharacterized protein n=1 Tax=Pseudocercospora fijiensis (strain CIRAD86) TaxID=383855 RepID=M2ZFN2_PSEFD|nr:uncharacterized protein MYCFIDRAFT_200325 [Pseudocercospora fijiensis CIRAD86]EME77954.1 hypothetical protein MYCFIDRAFT_200325 [Pseudocercospora fijiensis CIRAD86]